MERTDLQDPVPDPRRARPEDLAAQSRLRSGHRLRPRAARRHAALQRGVRRGGDRARHAGRAVPLAALRPHALGCRAGVSQAQLSAERGHPRPRGRRDLRHRPHPPSAYPEAPHRRGAADHRRAGRDPGQPVADAAARRSAPLLLSRQGGRALRRAVRASPGLAADLAARPAASWRRPAATRRVAAADWFPPLGRDLPEAPPPRRGTWARPARSCSGGTRATTGRNGPRAPPRSRPPIAPRPTSPCG